MIFSFYLALFLFVFSSILKAEDEVGKYIIDKNNGCKVWDKNYSEKDSVIWDGNCLNKYAHGYGTLKWFYDGNEVAQYVGMMLEGKPNGKGTYFLDNNRKLIGNFFNGELLELDEIYLNMLKKNVIPILDTNNYYVNDGGSKELFYYSLIPVNSKGVLVLFPSTWETAEHTISSNKDLIQNSYKNGIATLIISLNQRLILTDFNLNFINSVFDHSVNRYKLPKDKFILCGLSMGGIMSFRYTQLSVENTLKTKITPKAAINVDGPVSLEYLHNKLSADLNNSRNRNRNEAVYALKELEKWVGSNPESDEYLKHSIYSKRDKNGGNAKYLNNLPIRIYNDVDVNWWINNRGNDLYQMNALDQSAMINLLIGMGNSKAEFINSFQKGYRIEGNRHPHSWSLIEAEECVKWMLNIIK